MTNGNPSQCFIITDAGGLNDSALESIPLAIYKILKKSNFNLRQMENSSDLLLTVYSPSILDSHFEYKMMECLEMDGCLANIHQVKLDLIVAMKIDRKMDFDDAVIELQTKDIFKDQIGNTDYIKALLRKKDSSMVLVILHSTYGIEYLYGDFGQMESLVEVYRITSLEFVEVFFGKPGILGNHMEMMWRDYKLTSGSNKISRHVTGVLGGNVTEKQECKTIAVVGDYASEKCQLLHRFRHEFIAGDCNLMVNYDCKEVTITGKNIKMFQKSVFLTELQLKLFHCEAISSMSKTFYHLIKQNKSVENSFTRLLTENKLDSVVLLENTCCRPAVLGLNKFETKKFIEWYERIFCKTALGCMLPTATQITSSVMTTEKVSNQLRSPATSSLSHLSPKSYHPLGSGSTFKTQITSPQICAANATFSSKQTYSSSSATSDKLNNKSTPRLFHVATISSQKTASSALTPTSAYPGRSICAKVGSSEKDPSSNILKHPPKALSNQAARNFETPLVINYCTPSTIHHQRTFCSSSTLVNGNKTHKNYSFDALAGQTLSVNSTSYLRDSDRNSLHSKIAHSLRECSLTLSLSSAKSKREKIVTLSSTSKNTKPSTKTSQGHGMNLSTDTFSSKSTCQISCKSQRHNLKSLRFGPGITELMQDSIDEFIDINRQEMLNYYFCAKLLLSVYRTLRKLF